MTYNGSALIERVINSYKGLDIHVFIDQKTTDNTEEILKRMGIKYEHFFFSDFSAARNYCLSRVQSDYKVFIDDSYMYIGSITELKKEIIRKGEDVFDINIVRKYNGGQICYKSARITSGKLKQPVYHRKIHEKVRYESGSTLTSGYIEDIVVKEHQIRTVQRSEWDLARLNPFDAGDAYYIAQIYLLRHMFSLASNREIQYYLIQRITMNSNNDIEKQICKKLFKIAYTL